jgi:hypothetical protein
MYHSLIFLDDFLEDEINTHDDWHIVPSSRPIFATPEVKKHIIEIPGANGSIDLTESLTGYPVFKNRKGSLEFIVLNDYTPWYELYSEIMAYLHGKQRIVKLEDDPNWYYEGRFELKEYKSYRSWSTVTIDYELYPFKTSIMSSIEIKPSLKNIEVSPSTTSTMPVSVVLTDADYGTVPVKPTFIVKRTYGAAGNPFIIDFRNPKLNISVQHQISDMDVSLNTPKDFLYEDMIFLGPEATILFEAPSAFSSTYRVDILFSAKRL